jgi:hypothetical protein
MSIDWKDVAIRAAKTFAETAVAVFVAGLNGIDLFATDSGFWAGLAISAGAAGVSAVWNGLIEPLIKPMIGTT